jgi:hypothetical protein
MFQILSSLIYQNLPSLAWHSAAVRLICSFVLGVRVRQRRQYTTQHDAVLLERDVNEHGVETGVRIVKLNNPSKLNALTEVRRCVFAYFNLV